jgi:hypothetical protein
VHPVSSDEGHFDRHKGRVATEPAFSNSETAGKIWHHKLHEDARLLLTARLAHMTPILKIVRMVTGEAARWRPVSPSIGGNRVSRRSPFAEDYSDMIRNVHNGECCVRTYGTNSEKGCACYR